MVEEIVEAHAQTVVEQIALQSEVELAGRLPLNLVVAHIGELRADGVVVVAHGGEAGASGIVGDAVVATDVESSVEAQIVHSHILGEPVLVGHHPSQLHAGEEGPLHAEEAQGIGIGTKAAVGLAQQ